MIFVNHHRVLYLENVLSHGREMSYNITVIVMRGSLVRLAQTMIEHNLVSLVIL